MTDPFEALRQDPDPLRPREAFARGLRARVVAALGVDDPESVPTNQLPERKSAMTPSTTSPPTTPVATVVVPYLAVADGAAALAWYVEALGAVEAFRVVGDDGRLGHAEMTIGDARIMLSDEYPEIGVRSPTSLGGTATSLHLTVADVDALFSRAVAAGATSLGDPEDQPHGARHGTLQDPYGHRWMLSQPLEEFDLASYQERSEGTEFEVIGAAEDETIAAADRRGTGGGIWAGVFYDDALAGIRFLVEVFGFEEQLVITGPDGRTVVHSQLCWPEGGIVQAGTHDAENPYTHPPGDQALYVVTADPESVWQRCQQAELEVVRGPESPEYDPDGTVFSVRDLEGNIWSFGSYGLGA